MTAQGTIKIMAYRCLFVLIGLLGLGQTGFVVPVKSETIVPIIDAATGQLYGGVSGNNWLSAEDTEDFVKKKLIFHAYARDGSFLQNTTMHSAQTSEGCSNPTFLPKESLPQNAVTLVGAPWNAALRKPRELDTSSPIYREALTFWLREQGVDDLQPNLSQLWRIDLEGDGRDEVLIAAVRHRGSETSTQAGDYSLLLLRKLIDGVVVTFPVILDFFLEICIAECALEQHEIISVLDLNGDGKLEIITRSSGYESITQTVFSIEDFRIKKRLEWTCGS